MLHTYTVVTVKNGQNQCIFTKLIRKIMLFLLFCNTCYVIVVGVYMFVYTHVNDANLSSLLKMLIEKLHVFGQYRVRQKK